MNARAPDLVVDLSLAAHPSRTARKEMRRFLAPRAVSLVHDAGTAIAEVVRLAGRDQSRGLRICAWYDSAAALLRVEVECAEPATATGPFPIVAALAARSGVETRAPGDVVWFEMHDVDSRSREGGVTLP